MEQRFPVSTGKVVFKTLRRLGGSRGQTWRAALSSANAPMIIAVFIVALCAIYADSQNRLVVREAQRHEVLSKLNVIRAKLEGNINGNLQLVRGLVAAITTEPYMGQERYASLTRNMFNDYTQLRNVAAAPDLVIRLMYPMEGNEAAIGLDYQTIPAQRDAALKARDTRQLVLAGPLHLKQGGEGFVGRYPVFVPTASGGERFWGLVAAVVDVERLYRASGVLDENNGIDLAIRGVDGTGAQGRQFFGSESVFADQPVTGVVYLPSGTWQLAAVPEGGWVVGGPRVWTLRAILAACAIALFIPIVIASRLAAERQENFHDVQIASQRLKLALESSGIGVWEQDLKTGNLFWDARVHEIYGKPDDGKILTDQEWLASVHPLDRAKAKADLSFAMVRTEPCASDFRIVRPDGEVRFIRSRSSILDTADGPPKVIGAEWDVTSDVLLQQELEQAKLLAETRNAELEAAKSRIEHDALHDSLTGLPNRRFLDEMLSGLSRGSRKSERTMALLHVDLDRFKQINDTLGHAAGDAMLIHAAGILRANTAPDDVVARVGGDEFVVVCLHERDAAGLAEMAESIVTAMREPVKYQGHICRFGVSIGIALEQGEGVDPLQLLVNADLALYRAKGHGRNRYEFFDKDLQREIMRTKRIGDEILGGLERNEFVAYYQPQFDAQSLEIVGVEALLRWNHPAKGILAPGAFLKIADELNVVSTLDKLMLQQAKRDHAVWSAMGLSIPRVSVNVSARRLEDPRLIETLRDMNLTPGVFSFELVESIFLDDTEAVRIWNAEQIKDLGIELEIDDFGTGFASIVSLIKLQPRRLKIDRQLVLPITESPRQRQLVRSIIEIGKSLGIEVVGEGVETDEHARILANMGCDILQGYALGRPMSEQALRAFAQSKQLRVAS